MNPEEAFKTFKGLARKLARQYKVSGLELEDLEQEAYLAVLTAVPLWTPEESTSLKNFVCNKIRDALKLFRLKNVRKNHVSLDEPVGNDDEGEEMTRHDVIGSFEDPVGLIAAKRVHASESIQKTPLAAEVLRLRSGGLTFEEIGQRLGKSLNTVKSTWRRAHKKLPKTSKTAA